MKISVVEWFNMVRMGRMVSWPEAWAFFMSTKNTLNPSVFFTLFSMGVVRARSSMRSECSARDVQIFWPLTM